MKVDFTEGKKNPNSSQNQPPRVLVAPLDWGLGHATRCIPIIHQLLKSGATPILAGDGTSAHLLHSQFPELQMLHLPGYEVTFNNSSLSLLTQVPKILSSIQSENEWLEEMLQKERLDAVISDNRYGLFSSSLPTVFITHQLRIKTPGNIGESLLQKFNYDFIGKFSECWVPDEENEGLGGDLSHPLNKPANTRYIGVQSRFIREEKEKKDFILVVLSGPEPQRTNFENLLLEELQNFSGKCVFVRGVPGQAQTLTSTSTIEFYNHLSTAELQHFFQTASFVISRSGYSTIMDLSRTGAKSILIPTPGQTEQEYLGSCLMEKCYALTIKQASFRLKPALNLALNFAYRRFPDSKEGALERAIEDLLERISKGEQKTNAD